jgi:radical SAM protein with 4Fe4S-binding SPASM domain
LDNDTFLKHDSLCPLPWNGIFVNPDGKIQNCAISTQALGNINQQPLHDIINNTINHSIRDDMLNNVKHKRCNACYSVEENSSAKSDNESNRSWYKKIAINHSNMSIFDNSDNFEPVVLDLRWQNTCNFACVYCGPDLSSKWEALANNKQHNISENVIAQSKKYIFDNLSSVKHVYLADGEPLLMKDNVELLNQLYQINPTVELRINSNISVLDGPVFKQLSKFKNVKWTISVDSSHDIFEYMRWPGKWSQFVSNALIIKDLVGDQINFNMVWCILNSSNILTTIDNLINLGFHENMFIVQCLRAPTPLSVLHLPEQHIENLKVKINHRKTRSNPEWWLYKSLDSMYNFLNNKPPAFHKNHVLKSGREGLAGTIDFLTTTDQLRNTSSRAVFKELYKIYDSN